MYAHYEALPDFIDVMAQAWLPDHAGDRVAEVHGDPYFGNQGPQRRVYEVMSFCNQGLLNLSLFIESEYTPVAPTCTQI